MATPAAQIGLPAVPHDVTAGVIDRVTERISRPLPQSVRQVARQCVLDWLGCCIAGMTEPLSRMLLAQALEDGAQLAAIRAQNRQRVVPRIPLVHHDVQSSL